MNRLSAVFMTLMLGLVAENATCSPTPRDGRVEIACSDVVLSEAWSMLANVRYGRAREENAAFIVRDAAGNYSFQPWPDERESRRASFAGVRPAGAIAIIHTHPNNAEFPSRHDQEVAQKTGLPVYVVTRWRISKADRSGVATVWRGSWHQTGNQGQVTSSCFAGVGPDGAGAR